MSINLLPWRERRYKQRKKSVWIEAIFSFLLISLLIFISQVENNNTLEKQASELVALDNEIKAIAMDYAIALGQQKQRMEEDRKEGFLKKKLDVNQTVFQIIDKISSQIPDGIYFTGIERKDDRINFSGKSPSHAELAKFLGQVKSEINRQPVTTETSSAEGQNGEIGFEVGYGALE